MSTNPSANLPSRKCQKSKKRSLTTAFNQGINIRTLGKYTEEGEPPLKKIKTSIHKQINQLNTTLQPISDVPVTSTLNNTITFIVGINNNTKSFNIKSELLCNKSEPLKQLIECNCNNIIYLNNISIKTFEFINDYFYNKQLISLLTFTNIIDILYFSEKYQIIDLIKNCKHKLLQINGNINNWYCIMTSFEKYQQFESMCKLQSYFIKHNIFSNINDITFDNRFYDLSIDSIIHFISCTEFTQEEKKLTAIYNYLHKSETISHQFANMSIYELIQKYFMKCINFSELHNNRTKLLSDNEILNSFIDNLEISNKYYIKAQAISRRRSLTNSNDNIYNNNNNKEISIEEKETNSNDNVLLGNDVTFKRILNARGFKECIKIETTGQGSVWRGKLNNENVVIKSALRIYCNNNNGQLCENIMNEINILRDINKAGISGIINLIDIFEEDKYYCMVLEDGGNDLLKFTKNCHKHILNGNMLICDWQIIVKLIINKLVDIVCWLHENNYIHLDLSLENVLMSNIKWIYDKQFMKLSNNFKLTLIDFGAAQKIINNNNVFKSDLRVGKILYLSPQIYNKCKFNGKKSDVWSIGVILFTLIIGAPPWKMPDEKKNQLFQTIVLERKIDKILKFWKREKYLKCDMKKLLNKIFVIDEKNRPTMKQIKSHLTLKI